MEIYQICSLNEADSDYVVPIALKFSDENNIAESEEWANLEFENGLNGGGCSIKINQCNYCSKHLYPTEEMYHFEYCYENPNRLSREDNCKFCSKLFKDNTGLKNHEMICKENPDRRIYNCQYCNKEYKDYRNKIQHEITCELNKNKESYECQYCKNKIENKSAKVKHEKQCDFNTNKQIRIYFCQYCDKEFIKSKLNLVKHEKYYCELNPDSKKPEFKCVCGKIYSDKGNFAQHQKKCELRVNS